jgi:hypothetical protein
VNLGEIYEAALKAKAELKTVVTDDPVKDLALNRAEESLSLIITKARGYLAVDSGT